MGLPDLAPNRPRPRLLAYIAIKAGSAACQQIENISIEKEINLEISK